MPESPDESGEPAGTESMAASASPVQLVASSEDHRDALKARTLALSRRAAGFLGLGPEVAGAP